MSKFTKGTWVKWTKDLNKDNKWEVLGDGTVPGTVRCQLVNPMSTKNAMFPEKELLPYRNPE